MVVLTLFGAVVGIGLGAGIGYGVKALLGSGKPAGSEFENLEDFRRAMLARDARDDRSDGSVSFRSIILPHESDRIIYTLRPNLEARFQRVSVKTNSHGMRSPERSLEKPPGVYRIALLGDSFAFGWGVEADKIFAQVLEDELNRRLGGTPRVEVLNFGVPGYSTFQEAALFETLGSKFKPDATLVYFVNNDFGLPFFIKNFESPGEIVSNSQFKDLNRRSKESQTEDKHKALLKSLDANRAMKQLAASCAAHGSKLFVTVNPRKGYEKDKRKLWALRHLPEVKLLELRERLLARVEAEKIPPAELSLSWDPHPSPLKHRILGELLAEDFEQIIRAQPVGAPQPVTP